MDRSQPKLHIWPGMWNLPSWDPSCLAAVIFLQLVIPGSFSVVEDLNPDASITGSHGDQVFAPLSSIFQHVLSLPGVKSSFRSIPSQTAWITCAESALGDLVANMFFALEANWMGLTHPTLADAFPFPQRYYSPHRIRATYRTRLESADLWTLPGIEREEPHKPNFRDPKPQKTEEIKPRHIFVRVFEREKVAEKARSVFELFSRLLGDKSYFGGDQPSLLDIVVASHIILLLVPPFPDTLLQEVLNNSFPNLVLHANRMRQLTDDAPDPIKTTSASEDVWLDRLRFGFFGIAFGGLAAYTIYNT
ncbi:hypothetical protein PM082_013257 [Marasmius tenuissimus]|nr:hypothetical protein PM082_013257 [Marasmius tenuissimus]